MASAREESSSELWHRRLGHQGARVLGRANELFKLGETQASIEKLGQCDICTQAKSCRKSIRAMADKQYKAEDVLDALHCDLAGPMTVRDENSNHRPRCSTLGGQLYVLIAVDEWSHAVFVRLLRRKGDAAEELKKLINALQVRTGRTLRRFHSDGGGEFVGADFRFYLEANGTTITQTTASTPQHNGIAERMIRTLFDLVRCLLVEAEAAETLWGEAIVWAAHLYNTTPHPVSGDVPPYTRLMNYRYNVHKLRVWGCDAFVQQLPHEQSKLLPRTWTGIFVGYHEKTAAYRVMDPKTGVVYNSGDVCFGERSFTQMKGFSNARAEAPATTVIVGASEQKADLSRGEDDGNVDISDDDDHGRPVEPRRNREASAAIDLVDDEGAHDEAVPNSPSDAAVFDSDGESDGDAQEAVVPKPPYAPAQVDGRAEAIEETIEIEQDDEQVDGDAELEHEMGVEPEPASLASMSREARALSHDNELFGRWNNAGNRRVSDRNSRSGRALIPPAGSISSDLSAYDPRDTHQLLNERVQFFVELTDDATSEVEYAFVAAAIGDEPTSYKHAMSTPEADAWRQAMREEIQALEKLGVYRCVPCPKGVKPLKGKWVYKNKLGDRNQLLRRKARFVAKGFLQVHGRDYFDTHSPVSKMKSIKMMFSLAARMDLEIHQMDFDTAFLNAGIDEDIYMEQPEGFAEASDSGTHMVWKLLKALYGLKQASRQWNRTIDRFLRQLGYRPLVSDPCVYWKKSKNNKLMILCLYVDDTTIMFDVCDAGEWNRDKKAIGEAYPIKDLGECEWILNMKITRDRTKRTITLSQKAYVDRVVAQFNMTESQPVATPSVHGQDYWRAPYGKDPVPLEGEAAERYRSLIGALLYAANITRPDIAYTVGRLCRHTANPSELHWVAAKRVLRYLRGTSDYCLVFGQGQQVTSVTRGNEPTVDIYTDADWAGDTSDSKSTSGCLVRFNGDVINWLSKKQHSVAMSSTEAEYMALAESVKEALWYRSWIQEVFGKEIRSTIHCDNQSAIKLSDNDFIHDKSKHIRLRYHFLRDEVAEKTVVVKYVCTAEQQADILTKSLERVIFARLRDVLMASPRSV